MVRYLDAVKLLNEHALKRSDSLKTETRKLMQSVGMISSKEILSPENSPAFDNSAMDGFALHSHQTQKASPHSPLTFKVLGSIAAGDAEPVGFAFNEELIAFEIMTGAPMPASFDCCVRIEDCEVTRDAGGRATKVIIRSPVPARKNLREAGHDFKEGAAIIHRGEIITKEHVLALSTVGVNLVEVFSPLKVALIATGKELVHFEEVPSAWQIRNSTQPYLKLALSEWPTQVETFLLCDDSIDEFKKLVSSLNEKKFDLIVTTGAVSMGQFDFVAEALVELKAHILFHKVAIRPGKPILFAELEDTSIFSLPGNPISSVIGFRFFIEVFLRTLFGMPEEKPMVAQIERDYEKPVGLRCFLKAHINFEQSEAKATILEGQMSSMISSLLIANAWVVLDEEISTLKKQSQVHVFRLLGSSL